MQYNQRTDFRSREYNGRLNMGVDMRQPQPQAGSVHNDGINRQPMPPRAPKKKMGKWSRTLFATLFVVGFSVFLAFFVLESATDLFGLNKEDKQLEIVIPEGINTFQLTGILKQNGIIKQPVTFQLYAWYRSLSMPNKKYRAGTYVVNTNYSYDEIIYKLKSGSTKDETVNITFYEGMTVKEIANLLEKNNVCDADDFLEVIDKGEFNYEFMQMLTKNELRFRRLEGYIFPNTHTFYIGENPTSVAKKFLTDFDKKITDELLERMKNINMTLDETLTLASIIQKECSSVEEMKKVSSVFHNRLASGSSLPKLQSDVTINYVEDNIKPFLKVNNQKMYDAYNTYVCEGLPAGPISNPGIEAIKAALYPENTNYMYFLTDKNGKYYYAQTFAQHQKNLAAAAKAGAGVHGTTTQQ
ncbi:MAG TPA: endolytic transglycosylase MltG [Ruminococcaceae bacterium]|nr:endolytic transglycosylase MltG [Oscillospiraceae bacterium]